MWAATSQARNTEAAIGRCRWSLVAPSQKIDATIGTSASPTVIFTTARLFNGPGLVRGARTAARNGSSRREGDRTPSGSGDVASTHVREARPHDDRDPLPSPPRRG